MARGVSHVHGALSRSYNDIGNAGAQALAGALRENSTLEKMGLRRKSFGAAGAQSIAEALREDSTLKELKMLSNTKRLQEEVLPH